MSCLRWTNLVLGILASLPPMAHAEIGALVTAAALLFVRRSDSRTRRLTAIATAAYGAMIVAFFAFNAPVNEAVRGWTPTTLPK
jgi:hypothetical protein